MQVHPHVGHQKGGFFEKFAGAGLYYSPVYDGATVAAFFDHRPPFVRFEGFLSF
jgi:hypothetical protein